MKKVFLLLLPMMLTLASCNPSSSSGSSSQGGSSDTSSSTTSSSEERKLTVYFFTSYDFFDKEEAHDKQVVNYGAKLEKPTNPSCPDEAYPTFLGWSEHPVIDDTRFIIDFETYTVTTDEKIKELCLYGIWVAQ